MKHFSLNNFLLQLRLKNQYFYYIFTKKRNSDNRWIFNFLIFQLIEIDRGYICYQKSMNPITT